MILDLDRILDFQHLFLWKIEEEILTVYFFKVWIHYPTSMGHRTKRILRIERKEYQTY